MSDSRTAPPESELRRRVAELERELAKRSRRIVRLLDRLPAELYPVAEAILRDEAIAPRIALQPGVWQESTHLVPADVEETLADLWSAMPPADEREGE